MNIYVMKRIWFKYFLGAFTVAALGMGVFLSPQQAEAYQGASNQTGVIITVTYVEPINVRGGPNTVDYPIVGRLNVGDTAPALGVSPKREWVQISFPSAPAGTAPPTD